MIDVCLVLEGTYPFVAGGVSTWVHQLITAMKDIKFGIVYIAPFEDPTRTYKYQVPENVIFLKEIFLHNYSLNKTAVRKPKKNDIELIEQFYQNIFKKNFENFDDFLNLFRSEKRCFDIPSFFDSKQIWSIMERFYEKNDLDISFLDFFWTWRSTHMPLLQIILAEFPYAKVYHSISTGYAGLLASIAQRETKQKFFLTEHGIYTHERELEISQANWIYEKKSDNFRAELSLSFLKKWWIFMFQTMSRIAYQNADQIFTLYEGNKYRQIVEGANPDKIKIIPNGIHVPDYINLKREKKPSPQIALIGRVVSIKDIKTYIQAAKIVLTKHPEAQFYVLGPYEEEPEYYEECSNLVDSLEIGQNFEFKGMVNLKEHLPSIDIVVLTSLSEAQPYVILEANLAGIPVVSSDVGACREMLEGRTTKDQEIGRSGLITGISNPNSTAKALLELIDNPKLQESMGESGRRRVQKYYDQDDLLSRYMNIYERNI